MTEKQRAIEAIRRLPDGASLEDIIEELFFREKVQRGLEDLEQGRVVTREEARRRVVKCLQG